MPSEITDRVDSQEAVQELLRGPGGYKRPGVCCLRRRWQGEQSVGCRGPQRALARRAVASQDALDGADVNPGQCGDAIESDPGGSDHPKVMPDWIDLDESSSLPCGECA